MEAVLQAVSPGNTLAVAIEAESSDVADEEEEEADEPQESMLPLAAAPAEAAPARMVAISAAAGTSLTVPMQEAAGARLRSALEDESVPKAVHDYKAAIHAFEPQGITLRGVRHDPMLYSYLLDPTYSSHRLAEVALRRFNLKLSGTLAESADVTGRFAAALRREVEQAGLLKLYEEIDLPLVAGACRHGARRGQDRPRSSGRDVVAAGTRSRGQGPRNLAALRIRVQHQFAQATGRRALQQNEPAQAGEVRQGQNHFDRGRCAGSTG